MAGFAVITEAASVASVPHAPEVGSFDEQIFDEIYNGPKMRDIRRRMLWHAADSCS